MAEKVLTILHFNDVYNVEAGTAKAGAARFITALNSYKDTKPVTLFSGDVFSPSIISTVTKGRHLVSILNACHIDAAVFGNHDFDFGLDNLLKCVSQTQFPWLMSNIVDSDTDRPLAEGKVTHIIDHEASGIKIGLVGLVEYEWIDTLSTIDSEDIQFQDFSERGDELALELKEKDGCDIVIALTHMRWPNDRLLARQTKYIDLILGGHDHNYGIEFVNNNAIIKSGTDFREFSVVTVTYHDRETPIDVKIEKVEVDEAKFKEDLEIKSVVAEHNEQMQKNMSLVIGKVDTDLEGRFTKIRTQETNLGNFFADIILTSVDADLVIVNSGSFRIDEVVSAGDFTLGHLNRILPILDPIVCVSVTGQLIIEALENGVSMWPALEGRFPQVAGVQFSFNGSKPPGRRINPKSVKVGGFPLNLDGRYVLATKYYLYAGRDGYTMLSDCELLLDDENGPSWSTAIRNYFLASQVIHGWKVLKSSHRPSLVQMNRRRTLLGQRCFSTTAEACKSSHDNNTDETPQIFGNLLDVSKAASNTSSRQNSQNPPISALSRWEIVQRKLQLHKEEKKKLEMAPVVDGRIKLIQESSSSSSSSSSDSD